MRQTMMLFATALSRVPRRGCRMMAAAVGIVAASAMPTVPALAQARPVASSASGTAPAVPGACQDFYLHVNAEWEHRTMQSLQATVDSARAASAADTANADTVHMDTLRVDGFTQVGNAVNGILLDILQRARVAAPTTTDPLTRVLGTYFNSCLVTPPADSATAAKEKDGGAKRCLGAVDSDLSTALGMAYVNAVLPPPAQRRVLALTERLRAAMAARLRANPWMTAPTKAAALAKLAAMTFRVGNPDRAEDYSGLTLSPTDFQANRRAIKYVSYQRNLKDMADLSGKPGGWRFKQYFVNAAYMPDLNALEIPAVLLQPPFFDPAHDVAENYAGIGYVIGHEITHAFDTQGARYDATGRPKNWWAPADTAPFQARSNRLIAQYDRYVTADSIPVNGPLTQNENIADLGGVNVAYDAYVQSLKSTPRASRDGMTPEQQFFTAYASIWRSASSREYADLHARQDVHAPNQWRVNGVLANMPAFAKAFGCRAGDPMVRSPEERVIVW